jgi:hypothetical protein
MRKMPTYIKDYDDDFDSTFATFVFGIPNWSFSSAFSNPPMKQSLNLGYSLGCFPSIGRIINVAGFTPLIMLYKLIVLNLI